jgi:tripartite-type tricarboxylate transporter receptor subunit TctC
MQEGKLRVLAVNSPTRVRAALDVPTLTELGFKNADYVMSKRALCRAVARVASSAYRAWGSACSDAGRRDKESGHGYFTDG